METEILLSKRQIRNFSNRDEPEPLSLSLQRYNHIVYDKVKAMIHQPSSVTMTFLSAVNPLSESTLRKQEKLKSQNTA